MGLFRPQSAGRDDRRRGSRIVLAWLLVAGLGLMACGRYGPPVRERPEPPAEAPANPSQDRPLEAKPE